MPSFNYFRDIPNGPNDPSDDQPLMQINTNSTDDLIAVDHYSFGSSGNFDGWHIHSHYPQWPGVPTADPTTTTTQGVVYTKDVGGGVIQLFYRRENNGPVIQLTELGKVFHTPTILTGTFVPVLADTTITALPANVYGYIIFLSGNIVQAGQFSTNATDVLGSSNVVRNSVLNTNVCPITIRNTNIGSLNLQAKLGDGISIATPWRLHYWEI